MSVLKEYLIALGVPGTFAIALLDSAGVPLLGGPDAMVMLLSWQSPAYLPLVSFAAALGSTLGCWVLYQVGRKGGDLTLARFGPEKKAQVKDKIRKNDLLAVAVAMIGPPPFPTKLFILAAGAIQMPMRRFVIAVLGGRLVRYLGEGYLSVRLGDQAVEVLKAHYGTIALVLLTVVVLVILSRRLRQRLASR
ncbi:MAG: YqaA family protein [Acidobacteriota bacterium]